MPQYSVTPAGERFALPGPDDHAAELERLQKLADAARAAGQDIVVVMGVGFVGAVMAAIVADTSDAQGRATKFVIGCQRPSTRSYWKIPRTFAVALLPQSRRVDALACAKRSA